MVRMQQLSNLSDAALLRELHALAASHRRVTSELIAHLGEVDARLLHVEKGFSSLFAYCVEELSFSEDEACRRIDAARLARRFPAVRPLLENGAISLTVLGLLKPHLTEDNHRELVAGVSGASVRQAKEWLAARFPMPDVPTSIRKLPERPRSALSSSTDLPAVDSGLSASARVTSSAESASAAQPAPPRVSNGQEPVGAAQSAMTRIGVVATMPNARQAPRARVEPLSSDRFLVKLTASRTLRGKLELARNLMSHANPDGDLSVILERAVDLLIAELERKHKGSATRPLRKPRPARDAHVSRCARREVVARDGWRCSFVADDGRRCNAEAFLEFDHETPRGRGGGSEPSNLRLLCRAHNRLEAERVYGKERILQAINGRSIVADAGSTREAPGK